MVLSELPWCLVAANNEAREPRLTITKYLCHRWQWIYLVCRSQYPVLLLLYHRIFNRSNTLGAISGAATVYPSEAPEFTPVFGSLCVAKSLDFCVVFRRAYTMKHIYKYMACRIRIFVRDNTNKWLLHIYHLRTLIEIYTMIIFLPVFIMSSMLS